MKKKSAFLYYLDITAPFYYFYLIPTVTALIMVSFDISFNGFFPNTITSSISSKHKFLNDYFAICSFSVVSLIVINYFRYPSTGIWVRRTHQSMDSWIWIIFSFLILGLMNSIWFLINDEPLPSYKEWHKGDTFSYLTNFAHPYISTITFSLHYVSIIFITLNLVNIFNTRKYA